jgi:hypothetical protein
MKNRLIPCCVVLFILAFTQCNDQSITKNDHKTSIMETTNGPLLATVNANGITANFYESEPGVIGIAYEYDATDETAANVVRGVMNTPNLNSLDVYKQLAGNKFDPQHVQFIKNVMRKNASAPDGQGPAPKNPAHSDEDKSTGRTAACPAPPPVPDRTRWCPSAENIFEQSSCFDNIPSLSSLVFFSLKPKRDLVAAVISRGDGSGQFRNARMKIERQTSTGHVTILDQSVGQGNVLLYTTVNSVPPPPGFQPGKTYRIGVMATKGSGEPAPCTYLSFGMARDYLGPVL